MNKQCPKCGHQYDPEAVTELGGACPRCVAELLRSQPGDASGPVREDDAPPLQPGARLRGFEVTEYIGRGGMGFVYKAKQAGLDRLVALKVLAPRLAATTEFAARFGREAKALAALSHPNIVQVFDYGEEGGLYFLAMEYVDGASLRSVLASQKLSPETALRYVPQICNALEYAHGRGVIHRDIKPENILIDKVGNLKIADFGLAKMVAGTAVSPDAATAPASHATVSGQVMGTPHYMAPEQVENAATVDHRADIYSLGVVFYEMLTGELPLGRFPSPSQRVQVDVRFDEVVLKALEKEPEKRYQRASFLKEDVDRLTTLVADGTSGARTSGAAPAGRTRPKMSLALKVGLVFLAGSLIGILMTAWGMLVSFRTEGGHPYANPSALANGLSFAVLPGMVIGPLFIAAVVCFIVAFVKRSRQAGGVEPVAAHTASGGKPGGKVSVHSRDGKKVVEIGPDGIRVEDGDKRVVIGGGLGNLIGNVASAAVGAQGIASRPRMSWLALFSALCLPVAVVAGALAGAVTYWISGRAEPSLTIGLLFGTPVQLLGLALGIAALGRIRSSGGRLTGRGPAWIGVLQLPVVWLLLLAGLAQGMRRPERIITAPSHNTETVRPPTGGSAPASTEPRISWGQPVRGLQAPRDARFAVGEDIRLNVILHDSAALNAFGDKSGYLMPDQPCYWKVVLAQSGNEKNTREFHIPVSSRIMLDTARGGHCLVRLEDSADPARSTLPIGRYSAAVDFVWAHEQLGPVAIGSYGPVEIEIVAPAEAGEPAPPPPSPRR